VLECSVRRGANHLKRLATARHIAPPLDEAKMKTHPAVPKPKCDCVLRSVVVGHRTLIDFESLAHVLGRERTPTDPITVTKKTAAELTDLSQRTIDRMIARGRADAA
jgi:hypothetical protein